MKKVLVLIIVLMMVIPSQAFTVTLMELPQNASDDFNGIFEIEVKTENGWFNAGSIGFGKFQETKEFDLGEYLNGKNALIKITQNGGGTAYLDAVFLEGEKPIKANYSEGKVLNKLCKEDLDVTPVSDGIVLEFTANKVGGKLSITGRIENEVISKEPLQFPLANNYKIKNQITDFYSYKLNSNYGKITADGELDEVNNLEVFAQEYQVPGSGHPAGDTYFWVMNDDENLYVTMDFTPDNTYDGDKDYAKVYVNTSEGIKEFKVSVPENKWGNAGFTYTDKVVYEHKVYEFLIPLNEIGNITDELELAFVGYGTASAYELYHNPDVAYDPYNKLYLSVFEFDYSSYGKYYVRQIYGQIIDENGEPNGEKFMISTNNSIYQFNPAVAYDDYNKSFLVVWEDVELGSSRKIMGQEIKLDENGEPVLIESSFKISDNTIAEYNPDLSYDSLNSRFLVVWRSGSGTDTIYGRLVDLDRSFEEESFIVCNSGNTQDNPSVSYSYGHESFLVVFDEYDSSFNRFIVAQVVEDSGDAKVEGRIIIRENNLVYFPNVSINDSNDQFLVTWTEGENGIQGQYIDLYLESGILVPRKVNSNFTISSNSGVSNAYPSSFYDGEENMLSVWTYNINDSNDYYAKLSYIDNEGTVGEAFFTDEFIDDCDLIEYYNKPVSITGNNNGGFLIAYELKGSSNIGYRVIGDYVPPQPQAYIKFDQEIYEVEVGSETQAKITLFDYFPTFQRNIDEGINVTEFVIYEFDSDYITVDSSGLITGINSTPTNEPTTIYAYLNPPEYDPMAILMDYSEEDPYISEDALFAFVDVIVTKPKELGLEFVDVPYSVQIGKTIQTEVKYFDGIEYIDVTDDVFEFKSTNPEIATITSSGAITGVAEGEATISATYSTFINDVPTTLSAITSVNVYKKSEPRPTPTPEKNPIGQIIVDGKVIKNIYENDLASEGGVYSFKTTKTGDNAKLWLLGSYYKQIANKNPKGELRLIWDSASYNLPLKSQEVLTNINSIADSKLNIILEKADDKELINTATNAVDKLGGKMVSGLVDFEVTVEGKSKSVNIDSFDLYVERTINQLNKLDFYNTTAMKLIDDEMFTFTPSVFDGDTATIKYRGNGIFAIVNNSKTFSDIENHWAKMNVERLAARNIAFGKDNNSFAPNDYVTRAEFAVMITRALGITEEEGTMNFEDAKGWYAEDISTAFEKGLINGRNDGKFYPNERIKRKDMAVIIHNAIKFANKEVTAKNNIDKILSMFVDRSSIDDYAKESTAICADTDIIMGRDTKEFDPDENATRAEASAIIERMLRYLEFIN